MPARGFDWMSCVWLCWSVMLSLVFFPLVSFSLSSGIIRAPPPYRMVNAGLCDYKKKNIDYPADFSNLNASLNDFSSNVAFCSCRN